MPDFNVPEGYTGVDGYFKAGNVSLIKRGIKIHVSADKRSAQRLCKVVLPYLKSSGVLHKVRRKTEDMENADKDNQMAKFITIYPDGVEHLKRILHRLDFLLCRSMKICAHAECPDIEGDLAWGRSGYLWLRYGEFKDSSADDDRANVSAKLTEFLDNGKDPFEKDEYAADRANRAAAMEKELGLDVGAI